MRQLGVIFKACPERWAAHFPAAVHHLRKQEPALLGFVLMACVAEQTAFLSDLWAPHYLPDNETHIAWKALAMIGGTPDLLDTTDPQARQRFLDAYTGVMVALNKM